MKARVMTAGLLLIICAITIHYIAPNLISQLDVITTPLQGNMVCDMSRDIQTHQSQVTTPTPMNLLFHKNICSILSTTKAILELSSLVVGFIGMSLAIYGGLQTQKRKKDSLERNTRTSV